VAIRVVSPADFRPLGTPTMPPSSHVVIRCLTVALMLFALAMVAKGLRNAWLFDGDIDMQSRVAEYAVFRNGVYPNQHIEPVASRDDVRQFTVYPPYALVMFVPFFEPFGKVQGRVVVELLSLASLFAIAAYGHRLLRPSGAATAGLGMVAALAISGNGNAIAVGQFSILCAGALLMQIMMLERGRPLAAGAWWAVAMLKPQIGLAFAGLFLVRREWRGLALGVALLAGLSLAACWWTEVSPQSVIGYWLFRMNVRFADGSSVSNSMAAALGVDPRVMHLALAALLLGLVPILFARRISALAHVEPLFVAAMAAVLGGSLFYHLFYDNVMMFPLLFVALAAAARRPTSARLAIAAAGGVSLWVPQQVLDWAFGYLMLRPAIWIPCAVAMLVAAVRTPDWYADNSARASDVV
jgi:hypothetical protein